MIIGTIMAVFMLVVARHYNVILMDKGKITAPPPPPNP